MRTHWLPLFLRTLTFVALAAAGYVASMPLAAMLPGFAPPAVVMGAILSILLAALTVGLLRFEGLPLRALRRHLAAPAARDLLAGFAVATVLTGAAVLVRGRLAGVSVDLAPLAFGGAPVWSALASLPAVLVLLLPEELIFRGYLLRASRQWFGARAAVALSAVAFGLYHVLGTGHWGAGAGFVFLLSGAMGGVLAWAALRTRSLALPIGLHLGGNWVQTVLLPLHEAHDRADAAASRLFAPDLPVQAPLLLAIALLGLYVLAATRQQA